MTAIQCRYSSPYRAYPNPYAGVAASAFAEFVVSAGWNIDLYQGENGEGFFPRLALEFTQYNNPLSQVLQQFTFWDSSEGGAPPAGNVIDVAGLVTPAQLANAIQAAIAGSTGMIVEYTPGSDSFRMYQPFPGPAPLTFPISWSAVYIGGALTGPAHPSGITINNAYAPSQVVLPRAVAEGTWEVDSVGFVATDLIGLQVDLAQYTGIGNNPFVNKSLRFVAAAGPVLPDVAYVVIPGALTSLQVAILCAQSLNVLGFDTSPVIGTGVFTLSQPLYGPGGNTLLVVSGTAPDSEQILFQGSNLTVGSTPPSFDGGVGSNLFTLAQGPYGGNTTPLRFGKNYGMTPPAVIPGGGE